jgi:monovalent cation/proton antiporter MnhG/PhaG subunit
VVDLAGIIGGALAIAGALLAILGAVGVIRFPDVYTRIHAASITDTGGASLMILGLCIVAGLSAVTLKLIIVWVFIMLTSPAAAHAPWIGTFRIMREAEGAGKPKRSRKPSPPSPAAPPEAGEPPVS